MSDVTIDTVRSSSSGPPGRTVSHARGQRLTPDPSAKPQPDAVTNGEEPNRATAITVIVTGIPA